MQIHAFRCFGEHAGDGNPALVIEDDPSSLDARQAFARERNTTCVWIDPADGPGVAAVVDFFYPHMRSPLCLHATLAVAKRLFMRHGAGARLAVKTAMRGQRLELAGALASTGGEVFVRLQAQDAPQPLPAPALLARLLAAPGLAPLAPPRVASVGSPKLLVQVADAATLHGLAPDLPALAAWGKEAGVNGCYVYCELDDGRFEGRNFNHLDPALEDSATGVAAGALTALLGRGITLLQGRATGRSCLIRTRTEGGDILVGGQAQPA
ncbi:PhzF family phenazine biosynthesis protein [Massilia niastensis]|uniref:PhzF family phenazine biosynthesis protein n=1 Tax=Massilia niastensis TaxID=544911 RepID=UPI00035E5AB6|nr:PhzF family phenazine biosynthesis protein [Massilia niastensis]